MMNIKALQLKRSMRLLEPVGQSADISDNSDFLQEVNLIEKLSGKTPKWSDEVNAPTT